MTRAPRGLRAGDAVIVRQISDGGAGPMVREIGAGVLALRPEVGGRLVIELRRGRGLASSLVTEVCEVGDGQVAVKTQGHLYVLSCVESSPAFTRADVERLVAQLLDTGGPLPVVRDAETEYVRMLPVEPEEQRQIRVVCLRRGHQELFGEGQLLGEVEVGESLRFTGRDGRVLGTSIIEMVRQVSPSCLEVSTGNSRYQVEFLSGELP